eukprot:9374695-Karenia_brevis.AAC.1
MDICALDMVSMLTGSGAGHVQPYSMLRASTLIFDSHQVEILNLYAFLAFFETPSPGTGAGKCGNGKRQSEDLCWPAGI